MQKLRATHRMSGRDGTGNMEQSMSAIREQISAIVARKPELQKDECSAGDTCGRGMGSKCVGQRVIRISHEPSTAVLSEQQRASPIVY